MQTTLEKCCMQEHSKGTRSEQIYSIVVERECCNLQQEIVKLASKNNIHKMASRNGYNRCFLFNYFLTRLEEICVKFIYPLNKLDNKL